MKLILNIRVLQSMDPQQFEIDARPESLSIKPSDVGIGHVIRICKADDSPLMWYAFQIVSLYFIADGETTGLMEGGP